MGLGAGNTPNAELQPHPSGHAGRGWVGWPSYTRVRAPGCYAYQFDGTDFSPIVFRAIAA